MTYSIGLRQSFGQQFWKAAVKGIGWKKFMTFLGRFLELNCSAETCNIYVEIVLVVANHDSFIAIQCSTKKAFQLDSLGI